MRIARSLAIFLFGVFSFISEGKAQTVFINEIHYDNTGGDVGEGFEIAGPAGTDLSCYDIVLYNGNGGVAYATINLSGTIDDEGCGYGALWFAFAGIQNGAPDGLALYNTCTSTLVQFLSYEGAFTATDDVAIGIGSTDIGVLEGGADPIGETIQLSGTGQTYPSFSWNSSAAGTEGSINTGQNFCACTPDAEPTTASSSITFSGVACISMTIDWTSGNGANAIVVVSTSPIAGIPTDQTSYNASATFGAGDILNAGEFIVYNGSGTSVTISSLLINTTYYVEIFEYNGISANCTENYLVSSSATSSQATLASCTNPEISAILVDACDANEGINEFFTFQNGNTDFQIDSLSVSYPNDGPYCNTTCVSGFVTNPTFVASLNTTAGCAGLFVEADPIPANGKVIVFTSALPTFPFDFSGLCGTGPYYAVFTDNSSTQGRFANFNATCADRTLTVDFGATYTDAVTYDRCLLSATDGDYVTFATDGTPTYSNDGCTPTATLPVSLVNFSGSHQNKVNHLTWTTHSEINNDYFTIERSSDGIDFTPLGNISGNGTSTEQHDYFFVDESPYLKINYYKLKQTDYNGESAYSNVIAVKNEIKDFTIWHSNNNLHILSPEEVKETIQVNIYSILGRKIYSSKEQSNIIINTNSFRNGIYLIQIKSENLSTIKKIKF